MATNPIIVWTKQLGTSETEEYAKAITIGLDGSIYIGGYTNGTLDGQTSIGALDAFLSKYSQDGIKVWTKLLGTTREEYAYALTTGLDGSIYIGGTTSGALDGQTNSGNQDAFLTKLSPDGIKVWTKLLGAGGSVYAYALTTGLDGSIYISGSTDRALDGQSNSGGYDAFLTRYSPDGTKVWTKLLGTTKEEFAYALTTGLDGSIYIGGFTNGGLDGQTNSGGSDAFLTRYNSDGTKVWTKLLGSGANDIATALTRGLDGSIYIGGFTNGAFDGQTGSGGLDGFLTKYSPDGTKVWTKLLTSSNDERIAALTAGLDGSIYAGGYTSGKLNGQTNNGSNDAFLTKFSTDGTLVWTKLLGTTSSENIYALSTGLDGSIYADGFTSGTLDGNTSSSVTADAFLSRFQELVVTSTYSLSAASSSYNEGTTANFTLTTTNVASGTSIPYTLSGISAADISGGSLSGNAVVNSSGIAEITVTLLNDSLTEGSETLVVTAQSKTASVIINDTSITVPQYKLTAQSSSINQGNWAYFTLTSSNVPQGTSVPYTISGVSPTLLYDGKYSGSTTVGADGTAIIKVPITYNGIVSNSTITLSVSAAGQTAQTTINQLTNGQYANLNSTISNWVRGETYPITVDANLTGLPKNLYIRIDNSASNYFVPASDGSLAYPITLDSNGKGSIQIRTNASIVGAVVGDAGYDGTTNSSKFLVALTNAPDGVPIQWLDFYFKEPVLNSLTSQATSINEGSTATFTLRTTNVATGTPVPYTLSGISSGDITGGALTGVTTVDSSGTAIISVGIVADSLSEGAETLIVTVHNKTGSIAINDTSTKLVTPTYSVSVGSNSVNEGSTATFTLTTANVASGTSVPYTLSGISAVDVSGGSLSGNAVVNSSGVATISVTLTNDSLTEGAETLTVTAGGSSASTVVNDTSTNSNFESESNDSRSTADPATLGSVMTGQLSAITDVDYYSYTVGSSGSLSITFDGPTNTFQDLLIVQLYDAAGTKLSNWTTGVDATWTAGVPSSGTYYVAVSAVSGYSFGVQSGQYGLTTTLKGVSQSTYTLAAASSSVNEGATATFTLNTTNVSAGTSVSYNLTGISSADLASGSLSGTTTVASNGQATISVLLANDNLTEGTETLTVTAGGASASTQISDTSKAAAATYAVSTNWTSTTEGTPIIATLSTSNVLAGTILFYTLNGVGITTSDFGGLSLSGSSVINSLGQATLNIPLSSDLNTEGDETFVIQYYTDSGRTIPAGSGAFVTIQDTSKGAVTPTYAVTATNSSVNEGFTADFTITTSNVSAGSSIAYTLSGISPLDITGGALTGFATVNSIGNATVSIPIAADTLTEGTETLTISLQGKTATTLINDTSKAAAVPTYNLVASGSSVNEGAVATFNLTTTGVSPGTSVPYTISGVSTSDVTGGLSGTATIDTNGLATIFVPIAADFLTEGSETLTITAQGKSASVVVNDTSKTTLIPSYALSASTNLVPEGSNAVFALTTTNVAGGTSIPYTISGVSSADITGGALSGTAIVSSNGNATITIPIASDLTTEGTESLTVTAQGISSSVLISDTSITPVVVAPISNVTSIPYGDGKYFYGSSGSDKVTGTSFVDVVKQTSTISSNQLTKLSDGSWQIQNKITPSNSDNLVNVERVEFSDMSVALDVSGPAGQVAKILGSVFGPSYVSNTEFAGIGFAYLDGGMSYLDLCGLAAGAAGLSTPDLLVTTLLRNTTGTEPTALSKSSYLQSISNGASYASVVQQIADSSANAQSIKLTDIANTGLAFKPYVFPPTYSLSTSAVSVNEGLTAIFNLTTTNVAVGTEVSYTLSGISSSDLMSGTLNGKVTIGAGGVASINVPIASDGATEGQESLTISAQGATASIAINDTSKSIALPTYTLTPATLSVNEGELARIYVNTTNVAAGTALQYGISGLSANDLIGDMTRLVNVDSLGQAFINIQILADQITEGPETMYITMGTSISSLIINDTSVTLVGVIDSGGGDGGGGGGGGGGD